MTDILTIDYTLLSSSLTEEEIDVLQQYQKLAQNLITVKERLNDINNQITNIHNDETMGDTANLTALSVELQKSLSVLGTMFKTTVHNVLMHVDSNQVVSEANNTDSKIKQQQRVEMDNQNEIKNYKQNEYFDQTGGSKETQQQQQQIQKGQSVFGHSLGGDQGDEEDEDDEDDVDLGSGIDEETMNAVDRIQHELGISADDVDIHRQIADQLEIDNNDY